METDIVLYNKIYDLKKKIQLLEWDLSIMKNSSFREVREKQLKEYKAELKELEKASSARGFEIRMKKSEGGH